MIVPYVKIYPSGSGCKFGEKSVFRHTEVDSQPKMKPKKSSRFYGRAQNPWSRSAACTSQKVPYATSKFGKQRVHRRLLISILNHMSVAHVLQNMRTDPGKKLWNKTNAPAEMHGKWRTLSTSSKKRTKQSHMLLTVKSLVITCTIFGETQGKIICGRLQCSKMEIRKRARKPQETVASGSTDPSKNTEYACMVEAHESTRKRMESTLPRNHDQHIAEKVLPCGP